MSAQGSDGAGAPPVTIDEAFARARAAFDALEQGDTKRIAMRDWLREFERRRQQPNGGTRLVLPDKRSRFIGTSHADPMRPARVAAYAAMEALVAVAWPPSSNAEKQLRKRQKQEQHRGTQASLQGATAMTASFSAAGQGQLDAALTVDRSSAYAGATDVHPSAQQLPVQLATAALRDEADSDDEGIVSFDDLRLRLLRDANATSGMPCSPRARPCSLPCVPHCSRSRLPCADSADGMMRSIA